MIDDGKATERLPGEVAIAKGLASLSARDGRPWRLVPAKPQPDTEKADKPREAS
jgi:hypothetical protein